jgi:hypothetical protein
MKWLNYICVCQVQWNACYAISNAFHNSALQIVKASHQTALVNNKEKNNDNEVSLQELVILAVTMTLERATNFKVEPSVKMKTLQFLGIFCVLEVTNINCCCIR